jgi:hypothetical protein
VDPGSDFSLASGESAQLRATTLKVGFEGVTADSRCSRGEQCVWAGDAIVRVWLQQGSAPRRYGELRATPHPAQALHFGAYDLRLVRLDPYPVASQAVAQSAYIATFAVGPPGPPAASDR